MDWQRVYVLHQKHFSDSRYWVEFITERHGRISALWRKNKKAPPLIPFTPYHATWTHRGQQKIVAGCESMGSPIALHGNRLFCAFYINELCERLLLVDDESSSLFKCYENTLHELAVSDGLEQPLRYFEWQLICHLGFEFSFTHEGFNNKPICKDQLYRFNPRLGFEPAGEFLNNGSYRGADLLAIAQGEQSADCARVIKMVFRHALQHKLGAKLLKSREYFS
ncbi:MAG TPA: DNA repair protein RecO [Cellvibrionaceae bacterium]